MPRSEPRPPTLGLNQMGPQVQNTGFFQFGRATEYHYKLELHHLILLERGHLDAITEAGPVSAKAHDLLCFRPAREMTYQVRAGTVFYQAAVQFASPPRHLLTPEIPEIGPLPVLTPTGDRFEEYRLLFESICIELPQAGSRHHFRVQSTIYRLLALIASTPGELSPAPAPLDAWDHIHLRLASIEGGQFTPGQLAREVGVSEGHFLRVFKQRFGVTPGMCRMHARLNEAVRLLRETNDSVKLIAYNLGFDGAKGLSRAMKKYLNLTASDFRREPGSLLPIGDGSSGLYPRNQHLLPPGDRVDLLMARHEVTQREL